MTTPVLAIIWFYILGFILALYVMLDGFDLGVGILSLFTSKENRRSVMFTSLSTVWDANEVWLIIWGGALFGAFPLVYATALNALYIPVMVMLAALIFRGVSFEFHGQTGHKTLWSYAFGIGSIVAAASQGAILGAVLNGIAVNEQGIFTGQKFDWIHAITFLVTVEVIPGTLCLEVPILTLKTSGMIQSGNRTVAIVSSFLSLALAVITAFFIPLLNESLAGKLLIEGHREGLLRFLAQDRSVL